MTAVYVVCWIFLQTFQTYFCIQANSVDPDQTAPKGAVWSGSTLQTVWTLIRLLLKEQSDFVCKNHKQMTRQTTFVVIGALRVNQKLLVFSFSMKIYVVGLIRAFLMSITTYVFMEKKKKNLHTPLT